MRLISLITITGITLFSLAQPSFAEQSNTDPFARDLLILTDWFEGEFDNEEQLWFQKDPRSNTDELSRHERMHTIHHRIDQPDFGNHVFYVEEYLDHDPANVFRQRLVTFRSDQESNAIRMQQGFFKKPEKFLGAQSNPKAFEGLSSADVLFLDECDVYWNRVAEQYEGKMKNKTCVFGEGEKRRYSVHNMVLSESKYWRVDSTFLVSDDSLHKGHAVDAPFKMRRAKQFQCQVIFRGENGTQTLENLKLHSQGGSVDVKRDSDGAEFTILMRDKEYPFYTTRPDFIFLSVRKKGENTSLAYSVNDSNSRSLGMKMQELLVYCHLNGYEFREAYETLQ